MTSNSNHGFIQLEQQPLTQSTNEEQKSISIDVDENKNVNPIENNTKTKERTCCGPQTLLHPQGGFKIVWDIFVSLVIVISAIEIPLTMAFEIPVDFSTSVGILSFCIDIFLCCDICVTFRTAYYDKWDPLQLIEVPNLIALRYVKGWFAFDLLTSLPLSFMFSGFNNGDVNDSTVGIGVLRLVRLLRLLRVFRIYKMMGIMREMNRLFPTLKKWLGISQVMVCMLFVAHYFGCIWFGVGKSNQKDGQQSWLDFADFDFDGEDFDVVEAYTTCLYWSIVTLFTTGYGDIVAHNTSEKWVAMFVVVVGSIMTAYLVGTLTVLAFEGDKQSQYTEEKMDEAYSFGAHFGLSNELIRAITAHIEYHCTKNYVASDANAFVKSLPQHLRTKVETEMAQRSVRSIELFAGLPDAIMGNLIIALESVGCNAGYRVFEENESSSEIYVLRVGCARLIYGEKSTQKHIGSKLLKRGDLTGENCLISATRSSTLICETWCEFYILRRDVFKEIIFDHLDNEHANEVWGNMKKLLRETQGKPRGVTFKESRKVLKAKAKSKAKDNVQFDTIYEDLFCVKTKNIEDKNIVENKETDNSESMVDKMRRLNKMDSGLKDFKMKLHYKMLKEKGVEPHNEITIT